MKMTKKIFLGAVAVAAFALVGCAGFGEGKASGGKWSKTLTLDATVDPAEGEDDYSFSRTFNALSTSKNCSAISTTVTVNAENTIEEASGKKAVIGLAFDTHVTEKEEADPEDATKTVTNQYYDFILVGVKPADGYYYVERYTGVSKNALKEGMTTNANTIGGTYDAVVPEVKGWAASPITISKDDDGNKTWDIAVTQDTPFTYVISINGTEVGSYTVPEAEQEANVGTLKSKGKEVGQAFVYGNCPRGTKFEATFVSDKDATVGLFADEE